MVSMPSRMDTRPAPVEYAVAAERYLADIRLEDASRRVYRIALATWAWPLLGRTPPLRPARRGAIPPVVPLSLLDRPAAAHRLRTGFLQRAGSTDPRTLNRELSILRGAVAWWRMQGWVRGDPTRELSAPAVPTNAPPALSRDQVAAIFRLQVSLREQTCWHLLYETRAHVERIVSLNIDDLDLAHQRLRPAATAATAGATAAPPAAGAGGSDRHLALCWADGSARLLPLLLVGRTTGPLFLTDRRAPSTSPAYERCPLTGRGRLSYRRAAELFTSATMPIDPAGNGWTLRQLRLAGLCQLQS